MFSKKETSDAVSPVIGVILLVAVTVALVALATVIVFDIGSDVSDSADASVQLEQVVVGEDTDATDEIQATVVRANNVNEFAFSGAAEKTFDSASVGEVATTDDDLESGDTVSVVAELEDGTEEVLTSTTVR